MLRAGIVGCGFMGKMHAGVYGALPNVTLAAVADIRREAAAELAEKSGAKPYPSMEAMLAEEKLDFVDICLPTYLHAEIVVKAAQARVHILCEKPIALNLEDADRMLKAAEENRVRLMIAHCIRFWPEYVLLKQVVEDGRLGALQSLNLTRVSPLPDWSWERWSWDESRSGSAALDLHIHDTDYVLSLLGKPDTLFSRGTQDAHGLTHIYTTMTFGKVVVHLEGGWDFPGKFPFKMAFRAVFERGAALFDGSPLTIYEEGKKPFQPEIETITAKGAEGGNISDMGGYYREIQYFVNALETDSPLSLATPESSRLSLATVLDEIAQVKSTLP
jgi:predicted dehydrogenase